jgi:hypothetical protein
LGQVSSTPCGAYKGDLEKGAYKFEDYEENMLDEPRNELYLKRYYA